MDNNKGNSREEKKKTTVQGGALAESRVRLLFWCSRWRPVRRDLSNL
jgi:hypothetical protein